MGSDSRPPVTIIGLQENTRHQLMLGDELAMTIIVKPNDVVVHFNDNILEVCRVRQATDEERRAEETVGD